MYTKVITGTVLSAVIFSVVVFVASAAEVKDRLMYTTPVQTFPGTTEPTKPSPSKMTLDEVRIQKEEQQVNNTNTWNMYVKQKNSEMEAKRKELTTQKKELEEKVKALRLERATARKELIATCKQQKFVSPMGVEATPTPDERKEFLASERSRMKECWESVKAFDLETRAKIVELRKSNLTTEKSVLGLSTDTPFDESVVTPTFPW